MSSLGEIVIVLHAHLPFIRDPEHENFLEDRWLFEALTECYLPLLDMLYRLQEEKISSPLTISLSPTLLAMMDDPLLQERYRQYLQQSKHLIETLRRLDHSQELLSFYAERIERIERRLLQWKNDVPGAFYTLAKEGVIELITCALSHPILPLLDPYSLSVQIKGAKRIFRERFAKNSGGFWLPENAYRPGLEEFLGDTRYTFLDTHGLTRAAPRALFGPFAPAALPNGMIVFARDPASSKQIWSREEGYPGDPEYRDFYRDVGFDLPLEIIGPFLPPSSQGPIRTYTGIKLHRITRRDSGQKEPYNPKKAARRAESHASHFLKSRLRASGDLGTRLGRAPLFVAPFDAELFGHWWFEGPIFLEKLFRLLSQNSRILPKTPSEIIEKSKRLQVLRPPISSWGEGGELKLWTNAENAKAMTRCQKISQKLSSLPPSKHTLQAARELVMAQASDWPFLISTKSNEQFARRKQQEHLHAAETCLAVINKADQNYLANRAKYTPPWQLSWRI